VYSSTNTDKTIDDLKNEKLELLKKKDLLNKEEIL